MFKMISRCYATAICNGSPLLNVTFSSTVANERKKLAEKQTTTITSSKKLKTLNETSQKTNNVNSKNQWRKSESIRKKPSVNF